MSLKEKWLDKEYENRSWRELAEAPVSAISGVSEKDAEDLKKAFGIDTVREFAQNKYVNVAQGINCFSKVSTSILTKEFESKEFEELKEKQVHAISGVSEGDSELLKRAFGVDTIQELAENKYVCVAKTIVSLALLEELVS